MTAKKRLRVGVLFGGRSGEHEVSLASAASVIRALDPEKYEAVPIGITKDGRWLVGTSARENASRGFEIRRARCAPARSDRRRSWCRLRHRAGHPSVMVDVVFPVLHGTFGEDGTVQGLLELAGLPYVGAGVLGSAVGMDKDMQKRLFEQARLAHRAVSRYPALGMGARSRRRAAPNQEEIPLSQFSSSPRRSAPPSE